ncbi:hypothetical protein CR205_09320 [Alteribacter lacisalsi]|uniref:Superinfection immunity protein n=1 Tax=Alteribacter lacisalsi TaxID=2045244 RepID=A0A2W0HA70_9BACI|nr:superinfection immunity protein [Alteribacter lacisalsi]PYZ98754.1 hypothetical protein CR205_09320 [Alteribacter lacisalsi]
MEGFILVLVFILATVFYFLPVIIAVSREKDNVAAVAIMNILLGWTFIGWVIALVWAFTDKRETAG